ncbi:TetR/AcrR family transcriptional regulator C-terminal domain-containing protein [Actinoallomurus purpureus]|uniref:TetR/AcrR family transcriptional regulator C-terminal domain-containing protein n=1 Tax=Actinoallomurus purpureus TaxID=478114 RepID=UPI002093882D|nr:TetR/AcrR family transcriptional regulator C-terminal domain-containing protein [Actinoallomurus purpureus]MCO6007255.1 TetR/AcrR family transcriptional regulator C-terminal domain-containing protein [Actinoallomurus purpureus]
MTPKGRTNGTPPSRPARAPLDRGQIVSAALALIDADGLPKFSMRRLGAALGVDPMAVYRHVADQEALFDGIAEAIFDEVDVASLPWDGTWRELAERYCHRLRDALLRHPHAVTIFATRPVRSPASIDAGVAMVTRLQDAGFAPDAGLRIIRCLREYTLGHALSVAVLRLGAGARSRRPAPGTPDYNLLAEAADATEPGDHFEVGLTAILTAFTPAGGA